MSDDTHSRGLFCHIKNIFKHEKEDVRETIEDLIEEAGPEGDEAISEHEQLILNNVLDLKDKKCCFAMVPRSDIVAFHKDGTIEELAELMLSKGHSRIPIYGESLDDIIGIVHIIDLAKSLLKGNKQIAVKDILCRDVHFISPDIEILDLLKDMQANKIHMSIVIDEYGGVDGLVTIEDLLEEIVGNIEDEYDYSEQHSIKPHEKGFIADARTELEELKATTGIDLTSEDDEEEQMPVDTLGGYIVQLAQRIPSKNEVITDKTGVRFEILEVDPRRIKKVFITQQNNETNVQTAP